MMSCSICSTSANGFSLSCPKRCDLKAVADTCSDVCFNTVDALNAIWRQHYTGSTGSIDPAFCKAKKIVSKLRGERQIMHRHDNNDLVLPCSGTNGLQYD